MKRWFRRFVYRRQIDSEIEAHLAEKVAALIDEGVTPEEARYRARREFGNITLLKEQSGEEWSWGFMERLWRDFKYAMRSLLRNPAYAVTAVLTLALGVGANAAIFNLLYAVILRTLPVPDAQQLRLAKVVGPQRDLESIFSFPVFKQMQSATDGKAGLAGFSAIARMQAGDFEQVEAQLVSGNFFDVLGVKAQAGRMFTSADEHSTGAYPLILSDAYWSSRYGRDPNVIGQSVNLNNTPVTIAGVAGRNFFGLDPESRPDFWLPVSAQFDLRYKRNVWNSNGDSAKPFLPQREIRWISIVARIAKPADEHTVAMAVNQIYALDMQREVKGWKNDPLGARDLLKSKIQLDAGDKGLGDLRQRFSAPLLILMGAAGMVLLIASVNLASLALARVVARRKEIAIRCSVGASRGTILSQLGMEILILSVAGGLLAVPVAVSSSGVLVHWASGSNPMAIDVGLLHAQTLLFVFLVSLAAGAIFGLLPALEATNFPLAEAIKAQASAVKGMRLPWGRTLIVLQVMICYVLLTGAALFVRTFINYANTELGFNPQHVVSIDVDPLGGHFTVQQLKPLYEKVLQRTSEIPGLKSASFAECGLANGCMSVSDMQIKERPGNSYDLQSNSVNVSYFATVGMRLEAGRLFDERDKSSSQPYAIINTTAAKQLFTNVSPIGQHLVNGDQTAEIIGVLADARVNDLHDIARPMVYYLMNQTPEYARVLEVRTQSDPVTLVSDIRRTIHEAAPTLPVMRVRLLTEKVDGNLLREKLVARLASAFAILALALACLGVYGVLSYAIARRTSEIGIRLALGAATGGVRWMVLREAFWVIAIGLPIGIPIAFAAGEMVRGLLYGLDAKDPASMGLSAVVLISIAILAASIPAWRASRVDPNVALRYE